MHACVHHHQHYLPRHGCTMTATRSCRRRLRDWPANLIGDERNWPPTTVEALRRSAHQCQVSSRPVDDGAGVAGDGVLYCWSHPQFSLPLFPSNWRWWWSLVSSETLFQVVLAHVAAAAVVVVFVDDDGGGDGCADCDVSRCVALPFSGGDPH